MGISGSDKALMYALGGVMRGGASRGGYVSPKPFVSIDGVQYAQTRATSSERVVDQLTISEVVDATPNTCAFKVRGFEPTAGQEVVVTIGSVNNLDRRFAGVILSPTAGYVGTPGNGEYAVDAIDFSWLLTRTRISARYTGESATAIALDIVANVPGFTTAGVETGLPTIDEFTFTNVTPLDALVRLAKRIGGYVKVDYHKDVQLRVTDGVDTNPVDLTDSGNDSHNDFKVRRDLSQVITRVFVEGGGVNTLTGVDVGETILPVQDVAWYNESGGTVVSGPQRIAYAGTREGGAGSLVGPGAAPAGAPAVALEAGAAGVESGAHNYAYTFVTGAGESLPSPVATITPGPLADPTAAPTLVSLNLATAPLPVGFYVYAYTFVAGAGETLPSGVVGYHSDGNINPRIGIGVGPAGTTSRNVYRSDTSGVLDPTAQLKLIGAVANNTGTTFDDETGSGTGGANVPTVNTTVMNHVGVSSIGIGGSGTTSRKVYRTAAGGSQLKLLTTIADNTTTTYIDSTADGSLGANVPVSDTSGLTQPSGQIIAGATALLVAGTGAFSTSGGWVIIGNGQQVVRYTGISSSSLTGIPASGAGAITASIAYNSTATAAPCLTGIPSSGVGSILYAINSSEPVNLLVQVDDVSAQTTIAALIGGDDDGVIEDYLQDGTISETEALARGAALLELRSAIEETITFTTRDYNARAGRTITVDITDPSIVNDAFRIQHVTLTNFYPALRPTATVEASSTRFSFEDLLRLARKDQG